MRFRLVEPEDSHVVLTDDDPAERRRYRLACELAPASPELRRRRRRRGAVRARPGERLGRPLRTPAAVLAAGPDHGGGPAGRSLVAGSRVPRRPRDAGDDGRDRRQGHGQGLDDAVRDRLRVVVGGTPAAAPRGDRVPGARPRRARIRRGPAQRVVRRELRVVGHLHHRLLDRRHRVAPEGRPRGGSHRAGAEARAGAGAGRRPCGRWRPPDGRR
jgi:hypothetical protein